MPSFLPTQPSNEDYWRGIVRLDANMTLGNKKSIDISVVLGPGRALTIDVKAVGGKMDWLIGSTPVSPKPNHYVVLVSYEGRFSDALQTPRCWILQHDEVLPLVKKAGGKGGMRYSLAQAGPDQLRRSGRRLASSRGPR